jgi:hypothetical protein
VKGVRPLVNVEAWVSILKKHKSSLKKSNLKRERERERNKMIKSFFVFMASIGATVATTNVTYFFGYVITKKKLCLFRKKRKRNLDTYTHNFS